jgi:hypothetical protein
MDKELRVQFAALWETEKQRRPHLHDGELFYLSAFDSHSIEGYFGPYSYWYVQRELNRPVADPLVSVAVTGVTRHGRKVLLGRRGTAVSQDPGLFELAPSGGLSRLKSGPDFREQLKVEFEEELGVTANFIERIEPFGLLHDKCDHVLDILASLYLNCDLDNLGETNEEYKEFAVVLLGDEMPLAKKKISPGSHFVLDKIAD